MPAPTRSPSLDLLTGIRRIVAIRADLLYCIAITLLLPASFLPAEALTPPDRNPVRAIATPIAIFGADDRRPVPAHLQKVVERLGLFFNSRTRIVCTAFCLAENVIVTAAHCVGRGQPAGRIRYGDFNFAPNYDRNRTMVQIEGAADGAGAQHVLAGDFRLRVRPPIDATRDWALIRVPRGACPAEGLHVQPQPIEAIIAASAAGRIFQLAYHRDRKPWRAAYSGPCRVARDFEEVTWPNIQPDFLAAEDLVLHTCDTSDASSGSPLFMETDGEPVVVALSVGTYEQTTEPAPKDSPRLHKGFAVANSAVNAAAFADKIAWLAAAKILSRRSDLRILQERLRDLKLYDGRIDGTFGSTLSAAIEAYERAHRTSVTGLPTRQLMHRLAEDIRRHGQVTPSTDVLEPAR